MVPSTSGNSPTQIKIILLINNDNSWSRLKISYLITARQDLWTGAFLVDTLSYYNRSNNNFEIQYVIPDWKGLGAARVEGFTGLAGMRTSANVIPMLMIKGVNV